MIHTLKIEEKYYRRIESGLKNFEIRYNDRDYQVGDVLKFIVCLNGLAVEGEVTVTPQYLVKYIHSGIGLADGYVILGIMAL